MVKLSEDVEHSALEEKNVTEDLKDNQETENGYTNGHTNGRNLQSKYGHSCHIKMKNFQLKFVL